MSYEYWLCLIVVLSFGVIHFIEVSSFFARLAGVKSENRALAYAMQSAVFMATRFFSMMLLPVLGLIIDLQISKRHYLVMVSSALLFGFIASIIAIIYRGRLVGFFVWVIGNVKLGGSLLGLLARMPIWIFRVPSIDVKLPSYKELLNERVFYYSVMIFMVYSLSIFVAFFFGLVFPQYRTSISQLSSVTNAFAAVLLTFYVEPRISIAIDSGAGAVEKIQALIIGRIIGVGLLSQVFLLPLWLM